MYRIGIDLGGTNIKAGILDENNRLICQKSIPTGTERSSMEIIQDMAELVKSMMQEKNITTADIPGVGIGNPGVVDAQTGEILYSNNLGWDHVQVGAELSRLLGCRVSVSNDANCAALGEVVAGAASTCKNAILITLGTGVGGGIILDGKVFEGAHAGGAELGHTLLVMDGEPCTCGRKGCLEAYASATALIRDTIRAAKAHPESAIVKLCGGNLEKINGKTPFDAAQMGDEAGKSVVEAYEKYLAEGIANFVNIFRPDMVLLSGGVCKQGENLTNPVNKMLQSLCFGGDTTFVPQVTCAKLGNDAGIIGAAHLL